jgi:hypothetical protein
MPKMAKKLTARERAFDAMLAALKQATSRADADLKAHFKSRGSQCAKDYAQCLEAIALAEAEVLRITSGPVKPLARSQLEIATRAIAKEHGCDLSGGICPAGDKGEPCMCERYARVALSW